jgi:cytochrome c oxidase accessory protein FixG
MEKRVHLPVAPPDESRRSSIASDGQRRFVYTADVRGWFHRLRRVVFALLIGIWIALPLVKIGGRPLVLLDIERRQFFLFGATFNAQDAYLAFFLVTAVGFALALTTSLWGRVFCGFACPQTVFLDGVFRPIERLVEGPREKRMRRDQGPWTGGKVARKVTKHALYFFAAFVIAHIVLSFFVPLPQTLAMIAGRPGDHPEAFAWAASITLILYGNFAWFREQVCVVVCPYGRLQAVLVDKDSLVIGYDERRGEPRGKAKDEGRGACVDCNRCVVVCPTGIDIRNGLQLDCIGCTACIDACDEIMDKLEQPRGLIRYDSMRAFEGGGRKILRPRLYVYAVLGLIGAIVATVVISRHTSFEANLLRAPGAPFVVEDGRVRNSFTLHLVNKEDEKATFELSAEGVDLAASPRVEVAPLDDARVTVVVSTPVEQKASRWKLRVKKVPEGEEKIVDATLVRPK